MKTTENTITATRVVFAGDFGVVPAIRVRSYAR
jgi:hypothetical protein